MTDTYFPILQVTRKQAAVEGSTDHLKLDQDGNLFLWCINKLSKVPLRIRFYDMTFPDKMHFKKKEGKSRKTVHSISTLYYPWFQAIRILLPQHVFQGPFLPQFFLILALHISLYLWFYFHQPDTSSLLIISKTVYVPQYLLFFPTHHSFPLLFHDLTIPTISEIKECLNSFENPRVKT